MTVTINGTTGISTPGISSTAASSFSADVTLAGAAVELLNNSGRIVVGQSGSVIQLVNGITPSTYTTASSSMTATGYGLSITPTSTSSKILILLSGSMDSGTLNNQAILALYRATTGLGSGSSNSVFSAGARMIGGLAVVFLDSPATTSATTYNIYFSAGSSSTITWYSGATVTLMEIAA
jgi:hypothetical protein